MCIFANIEKFVLTSIAGFDFLLSEINSLLQDIAIQDITCNINLTEKLTQHLLLKLMQKL